jgi:hypothetical protein
MEIFLDSSDIKEIRGLNKANLWLTGTTATVGANKVTTITLGTGNVSWT